MATVSAYPTPNNSGPAINRLTDLPAEFKVIRYEFDDGGAEVNVMPCGVQRWQLDYEGLSSADAATLLTHFNLAKGRVNDFSFTHPREGVIYTGVKYESFVISDHQKHWALPRKIVLVKFV